MATTLRFISSTLPAVPAQRVYWKTLWADEWTLMSPSLWCNSAQWSASPSLPVAALAWRYGIALPPGAHAFAARVIQSRQLRILVKVEYDTFPLAGVTDPLRWYGTVEIELDDIHGTLLRGLGSDPGYVASGKNHFTCYGLEALLDTAVVTSSVIATSQGGTYRVNRALTFNEFGIGNRSPAPGPDGVYVFHSSVKDAVPWSSWTIANYLLKYHAPRNAAGQNVVPFELGGFQLDALTPFDEPVLPAEKKSVRELLNVLLPRERLTSWAIRPEDSPGGKVYVCPFTMTGVAIPLGLPSSPFWSIAANPNQYVIAAERDRGKELSLKRSSADNYDQVIVRGARRTSTATFSFNDETLDIGWTAALETAYELGASGAADYPAATEVDERVYRNDLARAADKFKPVYQRFVIPANFDYLVGDGLSGNPVFPLTPSDADPTVPTPLAPQDLHFAPELALQQGYDYQLLPATETEDPPHRQAKPLVLYPRSDSTPVAPRYRHLDAIGVSAEAPGPMEAGDTWSARVHVDADDGALWVDIQGESAYLFATADHARLDADEDPELFGNADFRQMVATLSVEWSEYAQVSYPAQGPGNRDMVRQLVLEAGDEYRLDYLCPRTIIGLRPETGELLRCDNGGFVRDDREQLAAIAGVAWLWYSAIRNQLTYKTSLLNSVLQVGSYITGIGDPDVSGDVHAEAVGTVITSMEIKSESAEGDGMSEPAVPTIQYETAFGELDVLKLV